MEKIPISIVELTSPSGKKAIDIMIDLQDYNEIQKGQKKIKKFKKKYFELVKQTEKIFYGKNLDEKKKYQKLTSSTYWKLGDLFRKFNDDIKNDFVITNYSQALERDFGRSKIYINELMIFSILFKKEEILDNIPMATYRALVWKKNYLDEAGILEQEKNRLTVMGKKKTTPGREKYKIQLTNAIQKKLKSKSKTRKKTQITKITDNYD